MNDVENWTWWQWAVNVPLFLSGVASLWFGLWLVWGILAKEDFGDEYRPWREIVARAITALVLFLLLGLAVIGMHGCEDALTSRRH